MKLKLIRSKGTKGFTEGKLYVNDVFECYTIEDQVREVKVQNATAIPAGTYQVVLSMSKRFKKILPEVLDVPGFTGIRIHSGNSSKDTEGCIIVGAVNERTDDDWVGGSTVAMLRLRKRLVGAISTNAKVTLEIV